MCFGMQAQKLSEWVQPDKINHNSNLIGNHIFQQICTSWIVEKMFHGENFNVFQQFVHHVVFHSSSVLVFFNISYSSWCSRKMKILFSSGWILILKATGYNPFDIN